MRKKEVLCINFYVIHINFNMKIIETWVYYSIKNQRMPSIMNIYSNPFRHVKDVMEHRTEMTEQFIAEALLYKK